MNHTEQFRWHCQVAGAHALATYCFVEGLNVTRREGRALHSPHATAVAMV